MGRMGWDGMDGTDGMERMGGKSRAGHPDGSVAGRARRAMLVSMPAQPAPLEPDAVERLLDDMVRAQRDKVLSTARAKFPRLTGEDVMTPEAYPELYADGPFNYEDGILNGLLSAQMALRALAREGDRKLDAPLDEG